MERAGYSRNSLRKLQRPSLMPWLAKREVADVVITAR